jgi:hypothetical protein
MGGYNCTCAPGLDAEMDVWTGLGGSDLGCCGDPRHIYGFHLPGGNVPITDYSRSHEVPPPYNMAWACAADFGHRNLPVLRERHVQVLSRLMSGDKTLDMVCEFIGKPWADRPVYYWARWNGIATLKKYTGAGHDTWSHISVWRSRANERPSLWVPGGTAPTPVPAPPAPAPSFPAWPGRFIQYHAGWTARQRYNGADVRAWQQKMKNRGWRIVVDGDFGAASDKILRQFQAEKGLRVDGILGPISWKTTWVAPL